MNPSNATRAPFVSSVTSLLSDVAYTFADETLSFPTELQFVQASKNGGEKQLMAKWTAKAGVKFETAFQNKPIPR